MTQQQQQQQFVQRPHDALFAAPGWATKRLAIAVYFFMLAVVSIVVGIGLAIVAKNAAPAGFGILLAVMLGVPAFILQYLTRRSVTAVYNTGNPQVVSSTGGETVIVFDRDIKIDGQISDFGSGKIRVKAPPDEVARMLAWIKANPDKISRTKVEESAGVSQVTWKRVMSALEEMKVVSNGGKSGYRVVDSLDDKLDRLEARL